ncbi:hypothetical protein LVO79_05935 [Roseivivax marinus]|uniref:hypothetical protein n=1 Tax=Roseivivax marinus TaxID=1379903 RepID=UPI001F04307A|nr:hypothetical protein [Roseivivax marinus]UMA65984.1 hypothetical protein LVO79_05935 [Roseivivax marinus]
MIARRWLRRAGAALVVLSLALLARELWRFGPEALRLAATPGLLAGAVAASIVYAALLTLPAAAWSCALRERADAPLVSGAAVLVYARCNILKYLPGNVFHFGGRQVMAREAGWSHRAAFLASTLEVAAMPLMAACAALSALMLSGYASPLAAAVRLSHSMPPRLLAFGLLALGIIALVAAGLARRRGIALRALAAMAALDLAFFVGGAALIAALAPALTAAGPAELSAIAAAYLASWVLGFVVPGAPGGLGVREAAFVHLAAAVIPVPAAVALALLARLVTTLGDLWFALAASVATLPGATVRNGG